jgi:hypothetical protein
MKRKRKLFQIRLLVAFVSIVVVIGLFSWLSFHESVTISEIEVEGNSILTDEEVEHIARDVISGKYIFLFSRENIFVYPRKGIKDEIFIKHKRVKDVDVEMNDFTSIEITIEERSPYALWCREISLTEILEDGQEVDELREDCYFLDRNGYIFANAPQFTGSVFFKYFGDLDGDADIIGSNFFSKEVFERLDTIRLSFVESNILGRPVELIVLDEKDAELVFEFGGKIIFAWKDDLSSLLANVESVLDSDVLKNDSSLDYIDFRFGNKVYFKLDD